MVAQILDQNLLEYLGMLVEQGGDIGFRRPRGHLAALHRGEPDRGAAVVVGVERQHLRIGGGGGVEIAGFLQRQGTVVGFGKRVVIGLGHQGLQTGVWRSLPHARAEYKGGATCCRLIYRFEVAGQALFELRPTLRSVSTMTR